MAGSKKEHAGGVTLDDLAQMVAGGLTEIRQEMRDGFERVDQHFVEVEDRLLSLEKGQTEIFRELKTSNL